ncbi:hypothetical protein M3P05_03440 [Sansalvadorimonas sp. 2012CJ34-2]|uniref:Uncharacterized protein n=1 Tax=Parendozoicomonas callyspongiae TaxID=2942213 RepID=A0ABT0PC84_9GAMM|nr:hypothetical protein [Sansalvadorimonas sp. 2012CJ34-2]MCL6268995.1 hypothetical protein [Sansalvadorimonas sp. 2012CJ34-2]
MELLLLAACGMVLYAAGNYVDFFADQIAGEAFDKLHEVIGGVSYFGQSARPIHKIHVSHVSVPLFPSIHHDLKVLCKTDCDHWFWFNAKVRMLKLEETKIAPLSTEEAYEALRDEPDICVRFFPDGNNDHEAMEHKKSA